MATTELKNKFTRVNKWLWELPEKNFPFMRVPARLYASEKLFKETEERALKQLVNIASLPGIVRHALAMPDIHSGYGPPIGGVGAVRAKDGVISPGFVGFDENCGVRLLTTQLKFKEVEGHIESVAEEMHKAIPSGVGKGRSKSFSRAEVNRILNEGPRFLVEQGFGKKRDIERCESEGKLPADASRVSEKAKKRGADQVGTLGSGNHFLEIQRVKNIFDREAAEIFGLSEDGVVIMIHTGSRGLGHQNCKDFLNKAKKAVRKNNINLPDAQLNCFPFKSEEGQDFFLALGGACNYSFANRQMITDTVRRIWKRYFSDEPELIYDVAHNTAKLETHEIDGKEIDLVVHRKGSTRAFPENHMEIPEAYRSVGQPVIMPGSMGESSYILRGVPDGKTSFYSTGHGAGRAMSRTGARKNVDGRELLQRLRKKGIVVKCSSEKGVAEEAPEAYKDISEVVEVVDGAGLCKKVAEVEPLAVIKGE